MHIQVLPEGFMGLTKETEMICFDYNEMHRAIDTLAEEVRRHNPSMLRVYPIPKGGDMPAVRLSHVLDEMELIHDEGQITDDTVVIDEIVHSGKTIAELKERLGKRKIKPMFCAWVIREETPKGIVDRHILCLGRRKGKVCPVKFPWETVASALKSFLRSEEYLRRVGA